MDMDMDLRLVNPIQTRPIAILTREVLHKLSRMWEGLFRVVHISRPGTVRLETQDGVPIQNAWNIQHLRKFYP